MKVSVFSAFLSAVFCYAIAPLQAAPPTSEPNPDLLTFRPFNISGNGRTVVGAFPDDNDGFVWTYEDGRQPLTSSVDDEIGFGFGISSDGRYISGFSRIFSLETTRAAVFDLLTNTTTYLESFDEDSVEDTAMDVSDNGAIAVGYDFANNQVGFFRALFWRDLALTPIRLMPLEIADDSRASAMNGAGTIAVGASGSQAVYWDLTALAPAAVDIGALAPGDSSYATDISRNGTYIVGASDNGETSQAFVYTIGESMRAIPFISSAFVTSVAYGVSNNGRVVGSTALGESPGTGFIWDEINGSRTIADWLRDSGVNVNGWNFSDAKAISEDGTVVVGDIRDSEDAPGGTEETMGYIAREGSGAILPGSYANTLMSGLDLGSLAYNLMNLSLHGAHHVPLQMMGPGRQAWVTGDLARYHERDSNSALIEVGGSIDLLDQQLIAGLGLGQTWTQQDLIFGGEAELEGQYLLGELSYKPKPLPFVFTMSGVIGAWNARVDRNYVNAGFIDTSTGRPDIQSGTLRFRVDWLDAVKIGGFGLTPKIEYSVNRTDVDGYAEQGGGFPAAYDDQSHVAHEIRYGFTLARSLLNEKALLRLRLDGVHRFDERSSGVSGQAIGLFSFNLPGREIRQDWVQGGIDFTYAINPRVTLTSSLMAATIGEDPTLGGSLGVQVKF
jgi:uncharacterized membrane protein